jgi:protein-L-isoaspartate(D-aspartate) O-methyltransferase
MAKKEPDYGAQREQMVEQQLVSRGISDQRVLDAMRTVPRHRFVPQQVRHMAYWDGPLSIGEGQTISQPYIVALMTELLRLRGEERVLEVGCGSGYQAAVLACLVEEVITIERHASLASRADQTLKEEGYDNVQVLVGDGSLGVPLAGLFDAIIITAAAPAIPSALKEQTAVGGRIVAPVGSLGSQVLEVLERRGTKWRSERSIPVMFVPLIGEHGWGEGDKSYGRWWT